MLGREKMKFNSPNVLDAGDLPPSAPTRTPRASGSLPNQVNNDNDDARLQTTPQTPERRIINTSMNFVDARDSATEFLKDIEVSPTQGPNSLSRETFRDEEEAFLYDHDDDDDDEEEDDQLKAALTHSTNLARSYAQSLSSNSSTASNSPKSLGRNQNLRPTWRRPSRRARQLTIPSLKGGRTGDIPIEPESALSKKLVVFFCLAPVVLIVLVLVPLSDILKNKNKSSSNGSPIDIEQYHSDRFLKTIDMLASYQISDRNELSVEGTPQYFAAKWIADVDPLQYNIPDPGLDHDASYHFVQRYVLVLLYEATGGNETWSNNLDFLSAQHECSWYHSKEFTDGQVYAMGVTCRGSELLVSDLLIPANNLQGTLPTELAHLSHLQFISFSHNSIGGILPDWHGLQNIEYIDLGANKLEGSMPEWIGSWSRLKVFGMESNRFTGRVPESLSALTDLVTLDLQKNNLQGGIEPVEGLFNLRYLYLGHNNLAGYVDPDLFLVDLKMIREIDISNNMFYGDAFPKGLLEKPNLQALDISSNGLRGALPETFPSNSVLEVLEINGNGFNSTIPSSIASLVNLKHLDMQVNSFTGTLPDRFVNLRQLTYLSLGENDFTPGPIPAFLSSFTQLRELSLARCNLVGEIPPWVDIWENLRFLNLQANRLHGTVPQQLYDLPELSILLLTDNALNGTVPEQMSNSPNIKIISLADNSLTGEVDSLCEASPSLEALSFDCNGVSCSSTCCNSCCIDNDTDSASCFSKQLMTALGKEQEDWEFKYRSSAYSFSPSIIYSVEERAAPGSASP